MEKHNSNKWQNHETKCRPRTIIQTSRRGNQILKLHHVRTPALTKAGRKTKEADNMQLRRKENIYKEAWMPWEVTQSVPILHRPALKPHAFSQEKEDEGAT